MIGNRAEPYQSNNGLSEDNPSFKSSVDKANFFTRINFAFVLPLLCKGRKKMKKQQPFEDKDLVTFPYSHRAEVLEAQYLKDLQRQKKRTPNKPASVGLAVIRTLKWRILKFVMAQTYLGFCRIFSAWILKRVIDVYMDPSDSSMSVYWWVTILSFILVVALYGEHNWLHLSTNLGANLQASLVSMLFNKISKLSTYSINKISSGKLINIATNDINLFEVLSVFIPGIFTGWIILFAGTALLWIYFGPVCLIGVGFLAFLIPIQTYLAKLSVIPLDERNALTDERVRRTSEAIQWIRLLKMYTWELKFKEMISNLRKKEVKLTRKILYWTSVLSRGISWSSQYVASFLMFMLYHVTGGELTIAKVFSAYYVTVFMRVYFVFFFSNGLSFAAEARLLFKRLDKIMDNADMEKVVFETPKDPENAVEFDNFTGYWTTESDIGKSSLNLKQQMQGEDNFKLKPALSDINLNLKKGSLNAVVGTVGASKTSLLLSFTGEMPKMTGQLRFAGKIAVAEQEPTIFLGTFRENILFGKAYEEELYKKVVKACNLENDLKMFPHGDSSMIGEGGNNLSGGQKARLGLARAIYSDSDIYLLDDPLSAVDAKVAKSMYHDAIEGLLKDKTVLLVTHRVYFVQNAENIIVMDKGKVIGKGSFNDLKSQGVDVNTIFDIADNEEEEDYNRDPEPVQTIEDDYQDSAEQGLLSKKKDREEEEEIQFKDEEEGAERNQTDNQDGKVTLTTYRLLFQEVGWGIIAIITILYIVAQVLELAFGRLLQAWVNDELTAKESLIALGSLAGVLVIIYQVKNFAFTFGFNEASNRYHRKILHRIIQSPTSFFDENPLGQILNRFSNDIGALDKFFPLLGLDILDMVFIVGAIFITLSVVNPILIGPLSIVLIVIISIVRIVYPILKELKMYHLSTGDNVFSLFSSSIIGVSIIRVYGQADNFRQKFTKLLQKNNKAGFNFLLSASFMGLCIDFSYQFAAIAMIFINTARMTQGDASSSGLAAFCTVLIMSVTDVFQWGITQFCQANILLSSAARLQKYCKLPLEAPLTEKEDQELKQMGWPRKGDLNFSEVYMRYSADGELIIKDLNLDIKAGEKIGCVGRTGAGKSSTISLLFRLQEIEKKQNSYIKIDEKDTSDLGLHMLRGNISIIPQVPFIFSGTVRQNIDPIGQSTDEQIWSVLDEVRLKEHVERLKDGLDTNMMNSSEVFSVGQKQLICLARTLLRPCKILVLDEATANMDTKTDNLIQQKIRERFSEATVFTIAHRLSTIANYDKVLVLDKGQKKEFDAPYKLLVKNIGDTTVTNTEGYFGSMVINTGPKAAQQILNIAKESYEKRYGKI